MKNSKQQKKGTKYNEAKQNPLLSAHNSLSYQDNACQTCQKNCQDCNLCQKQICIVGGVERMECLYRDFIEKNGGMLDYHSGCMQHGSKKLEKFLQRADTIICPINTNSHTACLQLKKLAKKFGKEFHMLPTGSLSAIKNLLQQQYS